MDRIKQLADKYGARLSTRAMQPTFAYNGKTIALNETKGSLRTDANIIHDIAHYAVASIERRKLPEFGLGTSPDRPRFRAKLVIDRSDAQHEEELASALGIYWEREFGMDWEHTYNDHCWQFEDGPDKEKEIFNHRLTHKFALRLKELKDRKLI